MIALILPEGAARAQNRIRDRVLELQKSKNQQYFQLFKNAGRVRTGFIYHKKKGKGLRTALRGEGTRLSIDPAILDRILQNKPELITIPIELPGGPSELELFRVDPSSPLKVLDQNRNLLPVGNHLNYRGIVRNQADSLAALTLFSSRKAMGFVNVGGETFDFGNIRPSKSSGRPLVGFDPRDEETVNESDIIAHDTGNLDSGGKSCEGDLAPPVSALLDPTGNSAPSADSNGSTPQAQALVSASIRPVRVTLVADYDLYLKYNSNSANLTNFITGLFNQVAILYGRDGITIEIAEIQIFTAPDPFASLTASAESFGFLTAFSDYMFKKTPQHIGDLAHLLSARPLMLGGVAYVGVVCNRASGYGFSNIYNSYTAAPNYSWSVYVIAHEIGHNLGSPHTHRCAWNINGVANQAIDGCFPTEGGSCTKPALPSGGGTIMSYCHLTANGIDLSKGFGTLPLSLIHSRLNNSYSCLRPSPSPTPMPSPTPNPTGTPNSSPSPTATPVATPTASPTPTATPTASPTPSATPIPSQTPGPGGDLGGGSGSVLFNFTGPIANGKIASFSAQPISLQIATPSQVSKVEYFVNNTPICASTPVSGTCSVSVLSKIKTYTIKVRVTGLTGIVTEKSVPVRGE